MKKMNKKGFTIVELVIVIAVIAILAAVLIPTFSGVINKANQAKDTQLVRNLNTSLALDVDVKHNTMQDALDAVAKQGYDLDKINASAMQAEILWDSHNDAFVYLDGEGNINYLPEIEKDRDATELELWQICNEMPATQKYSIYAGNGWSVTPVEGLTVGFDAGKNTNIASVNYVREASASAQNVVIRTNNMFGTLTIDAITDEVSHFGDIGNLNIVAIKKSSYDEYGRVGGVATLTYGKINVKAGGEITTIVGNAVNASDIELVVEDGGLVSTVVATTPEMLAVLNVAGVNNAEQIQENEIETVINSQCYIKSTTNVYYETIQAAVNAAEGETEIVITKDLLYQDVTGSAITIPQGKNITIDLNGKIIKAYLTNSQSSQLISLGGANHTQNTYLTIKDRTAPSDGIGTGMLYVLNAYESDPMNVATSVISANPMAYVTIKSGKIYNACTNSNSSMGFGMYGIDVLTNGGTEKDTTLIVDGGLVQSKNYRSIRGFCNATGSSVKITINGGSVVSDGNNAIWLHNPNSSQNKAELRINGGKIIAGPNGKLPVNGAAASSNFDVKYSGGQFFFGTQNIFYTYGYFNDDQFTDFYYSTVWGTIEDCENLGYYVIASEKYSGYYDVYYTPGMCVNAANEFVVEGKEFVKISEGLYEIR